MVWDELDRRVKEKQQTSAQHMWELLQDCWKTFQVKLVESVQSCHTKYFLVTTLYHMCYFIFCDASLLFYNVENSKNKDKPLNE